MTGSGASCDADWLPGAMSAVVIGQHDTSITAGRNEALKPSVRWRRRDKKEIGAESQVRLVYVCLLHTACRNEDKPVRGRALRFTALYPHTDGRFLPASLHISHNLGRLGAKAALWEGRVDYIATPEIIKDVLAGRELHNYNI